MSSAVSEAELPDGVLLERYRIEGGHVDCFVAAVPGIVSLSQFISAFYTSSVFRPERWLLGALLGMPTNNEQIGRLAAGELSRFSAWTVEERRESEILLCDYQSKTRSWLMVQAIEGGTQLHFGSAVVPARRSSARVIFRVLLGFHRWYSRALLKGALAQL